MIKCLAGTKGERNSQSQKNRRLQIKNAVEKLHLKLPERRSHLIPAKFGVHRRIVASQSRLLPFREWPREAHKRRARLSLQSSFARIFVFVRIDNRGEHKLRNFSLLFGIARTSACTNFVASARTDIFPLFNNSFQSALFVRRWNQRWWWKSEARWWRSFDGEDGMEQHLRRFQVKHKYPKRN